MIVMEKVEKLENLIVKACKPHLGKPLGLSGGVDSSLLAAIIKPEFVASVELPMGKPYNESEHSEKVAKHLGIKRIVIKPNKKNFKEYVEEAVLAIGRPIPHFNVFPLFCLYKKLNELGVKEFILGDGPDETMCGYARNIMMKKIYIDLFEEPAFEGYGPMLGRVLKPFEEAYAQAIDKDIEQVKKVFDEAAKDGKSAIDCMCWIDMQVCRPDMDEMSDGIANYFGIKNIRPYQDDPRVDNFMYNLPISDKICGLWGKFLLRQVATKYLPNDIAWRLRKIGGPVYPVNRIMGWMDKGEFDKTAWIKYQEEILNGKDTL